MANYIVTINQLWKQKVKIEGVSSRREALVAARKGVYTIDRDPKYTSDVDPLDWRVEEDDDD